MSECKCCTMKVKCAQGINKIFISKAFLSVAILLSQKRQMRSPFYAILAQDICSKFHFFPFRFTVGVRIFILPWWILFCTGQNHWPLCINMSEKTYFYAALFCIHFCMHINGTIIPPTSNLRQTLCDNLPGIKMQNT